MKRVTGKEVVVEDNFCGEIEKAICNKDSNVWDQYQATTFLRDYKDQEKAECALGNLLRNQAETGALLRHEIAFMLGNLLANSDNKVVKKQVLDTCHDTKEADVVRHESILAYAVCTKDKSEMFVPNFSVIHF